MESELRRAAPRDKPPRKRKAHEATSGAEAEDGQQDAARRMDSLPRQGSDDTSASEW